MNPDENQETSTPDSLSPTQAEELDRACDRFEAAWRSGATPNIEDYLDTPRAHRSALLGELIVIDLHWRRRRGEQPTPEEYIARFGRDQDAVAIAFERTRANALTTCEPDLGLAPVERRALRQGSHSNIAATADGQRFRIIREHARGGLGEVFVAVDTEVNREVALKEIRPEYANHPESRARFLIEAEVTGRLEHPGIVPIYSIGRQSDGRPFYAMRFVRGESLKEAINRLHATPDALPTARALGRQALLRHFLAVCYAVDYAHARGVVHRDLKPANIMLGGFGETLVVDWGLAKPIGEVGSVWVDGKAGSPDASQPSPIVPSSWIGMDSTLTQTGQVIGTPAFMSPEQAAGDLVGPASDIYSLGATLYAILTGRPPFEEGTVAALLDLVRSGTIVPPRGVNQAIDPALDAVCRKAMALKPEDRYGSVRALADDVERWLADEPTSAYAEPAWKRVARWGRRHRTAVLSAAAALAVAIVALAISTALLRRANGEIRNSERMARENLRESSRVVASMFDQVVPKLPDLKGGDATQQALLKSALKFYNEFVLRRGDELPTRLEAAGAYLRLGDVYGKLSQPEEAIAAYSESIRILEALAIAPDPDPAVLKRLAAALASLATLGREQGRHEEAEPLFRRAIKIDERLIEKFPADSELRMGLARRRYSLAIMLQNFQRPEEARAEYEAALAIQERCVALAPEDPQYRDHLASTLYEYGYLLDVRGETAKAVTIYERLVSLQTSLVEAYPSVGRYQYALSNSLSYLGALYSRSSRPADAQNAHQKAISLFERLVDEHPEVADNQQGLAMALGNLANFLARSGRPSRAEKYHRRALHVFDAIAAKEPGRLNNQDAIALTYFYIGDDLRLQGSYLEAIEAYDQAAAKYESMRENSPRYRPALDFLSETYRRRAEVHLMLGRTGPAITDLDRVDRMAAPRAPDLRAKAVRALAFAQSSDCERAVTLLPAPQGPNGAEIAFTGAIMHAVASRKLPQGTGRHAGEAVRLLAIAHQLGFFQFQQERELLGRDSRFDGLRSRDDYQSLVTDIAFPAQPFAP